MAARYRVDRSRPAAIRNPSRQRPFLVGNRRPRFDPKWKFDRPLLGAISDTTNAGNFCPPPDSMGFGRGGQPTATLKIRI